MSEMEIVRENLELIAKKGDLYDVIALKKGVGSRKRIFLKSNILFLSRILYMGVLLWEKIEKHFSPVEKVRKAQSEIRKVLGVNVDIVRYKSSQFFHLKRNLSLLYQDENIEKEEYLFHLEKILEFCELYPMDKILLKRKNITDLFSDVDLEEYEETTVKYILNINTTLKSDDNEELVSLSPMELLSLIQTLEKCKVDVPFMQRVANKLQDATVKKALIEFEKEGNLKQLKATISMRLSLFLNSEGIYKDREYGKVFQSVHVKEEYVKVETRNIEGQIESVNVMSLYDYLEVQNQRELFLKMEKFSENKELFGLSILHLHLCGSKKQIDTSSFQNSSLFDTIYEQFKEKKKISMMESKFSKMIINYCHMYYSFVFTIFLSLFVVALGIPVDFVNQIFLNQQGFVSTKKIYNTLLFPYKYSFNFEKDLLDDVTSALEDAKLDFSNITSLIAGDVFSNDKDIVIGFSYYANNDRENMAYYYATGYAKSATYEKGKLNYTIVQPELSFSDFQDVKDTLEVKYDIGRKDLKKSISNQELHLLKTLYPIGDYAINRITILDMEDKTKCFSIDYKRASINHTSITPEEEELLLSMRDPEVICTYGPYPYFENAFTRSLEKESSYTSLSQKEAKEAVLRGLGLESDAQLDVILDAIQDKDYSETPIQDAGLSSKIKKMNEEEYLETIASLDSLVCNLAATLAVDVDDELTYVTGYKIEEAGFITVGDSHAWAMTDSGIIVDVTPYTLSEKEESEIQEKISKVIAFGIQYHIPMYVILFLIGATINKFFGKKIKVTLKVNKIKRVLETENIEEAYTKINEILYGGVNLPRKQSVTEFISTIEKEFSHFSIEDLKEVKKELQANVEEKKVRQDAIQLLHEIPYIQENAKELQKKFK